tara:strand:- start:154 stop:372 length:219 start_codon:yes stop_codon:yes gene_type:complete
MKTKLPKVKVIDMLEVVIEKSKQLIDLDPKLGFYYLQKAHHLYNKRGYNAEYEHKINEVFHNYMEKYPSGVS